MTQYFSNTVKLYSESLFSFAVKQKISERISNDFIKMSDLFLQNPSLFKTISAPIYSATEQHQILLSVIDNLNCCEETSNFILFIAKNKRLPMLLQILEHFSLIYKDYTGKKIIEVIASYDISKKEEQELQNQLAKIFAADIELTVKENPQILGGIIIKHNNQMFDASLKTKFENLTRTVTEETALL